MKINRRKKMPLANSFKVWKRKMHTYHIQYWVFWILRENNSVPSSAMIFNPVRCAGQTSCCRLRHTSVIHYIKKITIERESQHSKKQKNEENERLYLDQFECHVSIFRAQFEFSDVRKFSRGGGNKSGRAPFIAPTLPKKRGVHSKREVF